MFISHVISCGFVRQSKRALSCRFAAAANCSYTKFYVVCVLPTCHYDCLLAATAVAVAVAAFFAFLLDGGRTYMIIYGITHWSANFLTCSIIDKEQPLVDKVFINVIFKLLL